MERELTKHLSSPSRIRKLLPRILASPNAVHLLGLILGDCALVGHLETYRVVAPVIFERAAEQEYKELVTEALSLSISKRASYIAQDLVQRVLGISEEGVRVELLGWAVVCAAQEGNMEIVGSLLGEGIRHREVHVALQCAASRNHAEVAALLIDDIMDDEAAAKRALEGSASPDGKLSSVLTYQCSAITAAIIKALDGDCCHATAVLLSPFIECMGRLDRPLQRTFTRTRILTRIPLEALEPIPRDVCFELLESELPPQLITALLNRLKGNANEPYEITIQADGRSSRIHRDILAYWSPYLGEILNAPSTNEVIDLSGDISGKALDAVVEFFYNGVEVPRYARVCVGEDRADLQGRKLEVLHAARFLRIESLVRILEK
ncbi:hypothetical protein BJY00DRAFT_319942 [Aspergillus carlsbadensis]|nr:hypothetical protein BJY00DRAFT_319942 [Aspergillus carlsbadensis]